jgi:putative transposase
VTASKPALFVRTVRLKVKREAYPWLEAAATEVNQVWNWGREVSTDAADRCRRSRFLSGFELDRLSAGACEYFEHIGADTIQRVNHEYASKRRAAKRMHLRWRRSRDPLRSLGWVPFKAASLRHKGKALRFCGKTFRVFESERLEEAKWRDGCFAQDPVGEWWVCLPVFVERKEAPALGDAVGVDLGCKEAAVTSDGARLESGCYRRLEGKIAQAQRRGHKRQAKRLHRKAANQRREALHRFSTLLVRTSVADVSDAQLDQVASSKLAVDG